ncbi:MAG: major capsid protein [Microvirus sp.]|nr:MAG: major capsid protein [Microvirus sp.]
MKRSKHSLSHYKLATMDMGQLVPVGLIEALPGDTFQQSTSLLVRMNPLVAPVMHPVTVKIHHWFVPNRLTYLGWEDFITGGKDGTGSAIPYPSNAAPLTVQEGDILDYMGVPPKIHAPGSLSLLPIRAYNKIYNEFYRDEDLCVESGPESTTVQKVAWEKDYFTTARPWSQKGPAITLPIGTTAPVIPDPLDPYIRVHDDASTQMLLSSAQGAVAANYNQAAGASGPVYWTKSGLLADLANATAADIIDIRRAFALQRYQEARAQYGSRYSEYLRYLGVRSSDARLQRPEYLGGGKQTIAFSEVLRTGNETNATEHPIGEMKGHGIAAMRSNRYRYFCEEHGYIITMLSIRPRTMYTDGLERTWSRRTKEDYYQKELELIGQQEVYNRELFVKDPTTDSTVFGYQDRYAEYRHQYSNIASKFRTDLDYWHMARKFADTPVLNASFIQSDPSKRVFADEVAPGCLVMVSHSIQARRMVTTNPYARII